jgi:hypothetical protein
MVVGIFIFVVFVGVVVGVVVVMNDVMNPTQNSGAEFIARESRGGG